MVMSLFPVMSNDETTDNEMDDATGTHILVDDTERSFTVEPIQSQPIISNHNQASSGFNIDVEHPSNLKFYFMELQEIEQRTKGAWDLSIVHNCMSLAGQNIVDAMKTHPNRVGKIEAANLLIFEIGDGSETNWPVYKKPHKSWANGDGSACTGGLKSLKELVSKFMDSEFVNEMILGSNPGIEKVLVMDMMTRIRHPTNIDKFIRYGMVHSETHSAPCDRQSESCVRNQIVSWPPPLFPHAEQHVVSHLDEEYLIVFQGQCETKPARHAMANVMRELEKEGQSDDDVWVACTKGLGRQDMKTNMNDLLAHSTFGIDVAGDQSWAYRFAEIVHSGALILRIDNVGDKWTLPFQHIIDWQSITIQHDHTIFKDKETWSAEIERIRQNPSGQLEEMRRAAMNVYDHCFRTWEDKVNCLLLDVETAYLQ